MRNELLENCTLADLSQSNLVHLRCTLDYAGNLRIDLNSALPIYRQVADGIAGLISNGMLRAGARLPATRELAGLIGLNRTTISAAYSALEEAGLIVGHVGRGSFVAGPSEPPPHGFDWNAFLPEPEATGIIRGARNVEISFANSRPSREGFPVEEFRRFTKQVVEGNEASEILQLGSPLGYAPLRRYLLAEGASEGVAGPDDDVIVTNGCQQALDLIARSLVRPGTGVIVEDPVYHGLLNVFRRAGGKLLPVPVDRLGMIPGALEQALERERPKLVVVTPSFQNPTGVSLPIERRQQILTLVQNAGALLIENDIYSELRYTGEQLTRLKKLDTSGSTVLLRSYSKIAFPGLRVGWVIAPRPFIGRLAQEKQTSDLHSDQLSQAVLLRFAESGELAKHLERTRVAGGLRLQAAVEGCREFMPSGTRCTRPEGGMNLWVDMPAPLSADRLLARTIPYGVDFLPASYFSSNPAHSGGLRICFGGLAPETIRDGLKIIGDVARAELLRSKSAASYEPAAALV